jgi:hypothetical protein
MSHRSAVLTAVLATVAIAALVGACSQDSDTSGPTTRPPTSTSTGGASTGATTADGTTTDATEGDLTIVDLNVLHGLALDGACPPETESCQAAARLDILWEQIEDAACPDIVTLQEVGPAQIELLPQRVGDLCEGQYEIASEWIGLPVEVAILTSLPVLDHQGWRMSGINWAAQWAKVDTDLGAVEIVTAHFASSAEPFACADGEDYCVPFCPEDARPGDCHPLEVLDAFQADPPTVMQVVTGDLNRPIDDPRIQTLIDAGFVDAWTLAGNPECDPATGEGCTCCVGGEGPLAGLDEPDQVFGGRIDFVLARPPAPCELVADGPDDGDGDGTVTGPFAREPRSTAVAGVFWSSDHSGVQADLSCAPS